MISIIVVAFFLIVSAIALINDIRKVRNWKTPTANPTIYNPDEIEIGSYKDFSRDYSGTTCNVDSQSDEAGTCPSEVDFGHALHSMGDGFHSEVDFGNALHSMGDGFHH